MKQKLVTFCTLLLAPLAAQMSAAEPFAPDEHTLLLAHFDDNVSRADYAQGISLFAGNGARLTKGWSGRALNLHARGLHERFMETCEDYTPEFEGWGFHARGNAHWSSGSSLPIRTQARYCQTPRCLMLTFSAR